MLGVFVFEPPARAPRGRVLASPRTCELRGLPPVAERLADAEPFEGAAPAGALVEEPVLVDELAPLDPGPLDPEPPPGLCSSAEPRSS
jgi:hypothetical protein